MAEPNDPPQCVTTAQMVIDWYRQYLGRDPENEGAITGRLGMDCVVVQDQIANSLEATLRRSGAGPILVPQGPTGTQGGGKKPTAIDNVPDIPGLRGALEWLNSALGGKVDDVLAATTAATDALKGQMDQLVAKALPPVQAAVKGLESALTQTVGNLVPNTLSLLGQGLGGIGNLVSAIFSNMADIGDIGDVLVETVKDHEEGIDAFVNNSFGGAFAFGIQSAIRLVLPNIESDHPIADGIEFAVRQYVERVQERVNA